MTLSFEDFGPRLVAAGTVALVVGFFPANLLVILGVPHLASSRKFLLSLVSGLTALGLADLGEDKAQWLVLSRIILAGAVVGIIFYDWQYLIIPDVLTALIVIAALLVVLPNGQIISGLVGATICAGLLALVAAAWKSVRGMEGLGFGDVKLAGALGLLLGVQAGLWAIAAASISASFWALWRQRRGPSGQVQKIPLGAFLGISGLVLSIVVRP